MKLVKKKSILLPLIWAIVLGGGLLFTAWQITRRIRASYGYHVKATFAELPTDDDALENWLKQQPGVVEHTVHVQRQMKTVDVMFIMSQDMLGKLSFLYLDEAANTLGYRGPTEAWHDVR